MLIQIQNSEEMVNTETADRPIDAFPPVFQIWDAPYSVCPHGYSVMFVPTYPHADNVCIGKYMDLTQAAQAYAGLIYAFNCNEKLYKMPNEKSIWELMRKRIVADIDLKRDIQNKKLPKGTMEDIENGTTLIAYEADFEPNKTGPKVVRCIPGHSVDKALAYDYIEYFWRTESREWIILGGKTNEERTQK